MRVSGEKNGSWQPEAFCGPKDDRGKMPRQETLWQSKRMRSSACRWRTNCCGIFCTSQEGSERKGKIPHHISSQRGISNIRHVRVFCSIQKRLLCLCPPPGQAGEGCRPCRNNSTAAGTQLPYLWLPADVAMAEKPEYFP